MRRSTASCLLAILFLAVFVRLSPLTQFLFFGSDIGEYFRILRGLAVTGHVSLAYNGWGITYPYFPGMFFPVVGASFVGLEIGASLSLVIPIVGSLVTVVVFLITTRLLREDGAGLIAAAFLAVAMPQAFLTAHPAPAALGELFVASALLLFLRLRREPRMWVLLLPLTVALIVTHHLSTYFLLIMAVVATGVSSLVAARLPARSQVAYLLVLAILTFAYWFGYATTFRVAFLTDANVSPWWLPLIAFPALVLALAAAILLRRKAAWRYRPRYPTFRHVFLMFAIAMVALLAIVTLSAMAAIPGTTIRLASTALLFFLPQFAFVAFAGSGRRHADFARDGIAANGWFLGLLLSIVAGSLWAPRVLIPYRHIEYVVLALAVFIGAGLSRVSDLGPLPKAPAAAVGISALLVVGGVATAIPPPSLLSGYQEGIRPAAVDAAYWTGAYATRLVATDRRASTLVFGFGGADATWDRAPRSLVASSFLEARAEMESVSAPSGQRRVDFVLIDADLVQGVQLFPWEPSNPMPPAALAKFAEPPYVKIFDSGYAQVYWVNWGLAP